MNALSKTQNTQLATAEQNEAVRTALKNSLYPGAQDASIDLVLAYCRAGGYDPMMKPVHIVNMKVSTGKKDNNGWDIKEARDVIMPGIGLYRTNAARTEEYAGCSEPEFGPTLQLPVMKEVWVDGPNSKRTKKTVESHVSYPEWCKVTVTRIVKGQECKFTAKEYWLENFAEKNDGSPNSMWEKRAFGQLAKCTEAQALRKAFPEAVGSQPTAEEMEGKGDFIEGQATVVTEPQRVEMPKAKVITDESKEPPVDAKPGIDLPAGPLKLLTMKAKNAGFLNDANELDEEALLAKFPSINLANINDITAQLSKIAEDRDAG